jgi:hypothetical protein
LAVARAAGWAPQLLGNYYPQAATDGLKPMHHLRSSLPVRNMLSSTSAVR